jgi:hypothetical protein
VYDEALCVSNVSEVGEKFHRFNEFSPCYGRVEGREMRIATFAKPQGDEISSKSRLAQFKQRYKQFPKVGLKVDVVTDDNGYWKIAL